MIFTNSNVQVFLPYCGQVLSGLFFFTFFLLFSLDLTKFLLHKNAKKYNDRNIYSTVDATEADINEVEIKFLSV